MTINKYVIVVALVVVFGAGYLIGGRATNVGSIYPGGQTQIIPQNFVNGASFGISGQSSFDKSGVLTTSGANTFSGATTFSGGVTLSGTNTVSGATTFSGKTLIQASASSTLIVGGAGTGGGYNAGCIKLGDSGNSTTSPVYITASGSTLTATTVRPTICSAQ